MTAQSAKNGRRTITIETNTDIRKLFGDAIDIVVRKSPRNGHYIAEVPGLSWKAETSSGLDYTGYCIFTAKDKFSVRKESENFLANPYDVVCEKCKPLGIKRVTLHYDPKPANG